MQNKTILITGGTGSWGRQEEYHHNPKLTFIIGDIRDKYEIMQACHQVDYIYHLAALK